MLPASSTSARRVLDTVRVHLPGMLCIPSSHLLAARIIINRPQAYLFFFSLVELRVFFYRAMDTDRFYIIQGCTLHIVRLAYFPAVAISSDLSTGNTDLIGFHKPLLDYTVCKKRSETASPVSAAQTCTQAFVNNTTARK
jgi:hypothetical protein